jgi:hypothetical protein
MNYLVARCEVSTACNFCCQHNLNLSLAAIRIYENLYNLKRDALDLILTIELNRLSSRPNKGCLFKAKQRSKLRGIRTNYLI